MRVAMLGQYPMDEERIMGGVEAVMVPLLRALARLDLLSLGPPASAAKERNLELHVVTCLPGVQDRLSATQAGLPLRILKRRRLGRATFHIRDVASIARTVRSLSPDVVHAQGLGIYAAAATHSPYPHVVTAHGIIFREAEFATGLLPRWRGFMDSVYERYCLARTENLISISPYVEEDLLRRHGFQGRVFPIENPVDDVFFTVSAQQAESRSLQTKEPTILYAGRVIPRKGLLDLLRALVEVQKAVPQVRLRVAGETESAKAYFEACRQFIAQQSLDSAVTFLGSLTMEQMAKEYAWCTVLALPSKQETAPVAVAEAMAVGRPVVATRICGVPYMVEDGVSGLLVDYGDTAALADALVRILSDDQLCTRMGQRGREIAQARFHPDVAARETYQVYRLLASRSAGLPA